MIEESGFAEICVKTWIKTWDEVINAFNQVGDLENVLDDTNILTAIRDSINSVTKTYRYVLPTQIIAKFVNPSIDAKCIQVQRGGAGAFDARTIAHQVIVPFDRQNYDVLGGAPEPYVNNPLRVPEISLEPRIRNQQKNKQDWDKLFLVLDVVEAINTVEYTAKVLRQVQIEIARRLARVKVTYPIPRRISLEKLEEILLDFFSTPSGGDRYQAIATALFLVIGRRFNFYSEVIRRKTNAADTSSGQVADIECVNEEGRVVIAVEVKDRRLEINHIVDKLGQMRESNVSEILYLVKEGISANSVDTIKELTRKEFSSGQNIYIFDLLAFSKVVFTLLGEEGRREFLEDVGKVLDEYSSPLVTKRYWAELLSNI